jgi:hypothetical protein
MDQHTTPTIEQRCICGASYTVPALSFRATLCPSCYWIVEQQIAVEQIVEAAAGRGVPPTELDAFEEAWTEHTETMDVATKQGVTPEQEAALRWEWGSQLDQWRARLTA